MSYILAGVKYRKPKRSMERHCRTYFDRNASLGSRIPAHIKYYILLRFLRLILIGENGNSYEVGLENPKARDHLVHTSSGLSITLKWILKKYGRLN